MIHLRRFLELKADVVSTGFVDLFKMGKRKEVLASELYGNMVFYFPYRYLKTMT